MKTLSQDTPNSNLVTECLDCGLIFSARVVITAKGNNAGNTLYAHTVSPSKKLCIYLVGAEINIAATPINSPVNKTLKYFTG